MSLTGPIDPWIRTLSTLIPNQLPTLNFALGDNADMLRDSVMRFASDEIAPRAADIDRDNDFPADLWRKMGELGILGVTVEDVDSIVSVGQAIVPIVVTPLPPSPAVPPPSPSPPCLPRSDIDIREHATVAYRSYRIAIRMIVRLCTDYADRGTPLWVLAFLRERVPSVKS